MRDAMSETIERVDEVRPTDLTEGLLAKFQEIDRELREETGGVVLFGLFERKEAAGLWDVLVAADWVGTNVAPAVAYAADKIQRKLTPAELVSLSGVIALHSSEPSVQRLVGPLKVRAMNLIENCTFNGLFIARAWIFTADINSRSHFQPPAYVVVPQESEKARIARRKKELVRVRTWRVQAFKRAGLAYEGAGKKARPVYKDTELRKYSPEELDAFLVEDTLNLGTSSEVETKHSG
jgi:hypothetical protein